MTFINVILRSPLMADDEESPVLRFANLLFVSDGEHSPGDQQKSAGAESDNIF